MQNYGPTEIKSDDKTKHASEQGYTVIDKPLTRWDSVISAVFTHISCLHLQSCYSQISEAKIHILNTHISPINYFALQANLNLSYI